GWTLVRNIRDPQKFSNTLDTLRGMITKMFGGEGAKLRVLEVDGVRVEYFDFGHSFSPVSPAWAMVGDKFILALYPQIVEDAARHITQGGKSLLDNPDYV